MHVDGATIAFKGDFTVEKVTNFIRIYKNGLFPRLSQQTFRELSGNKLAIYAHDAGESVRDLVDMAPEFNRSELVYAHLDAAEIPQLVEHFECTLLPCAIVMDGHKRYSMSVEDHEGFLPFVHLVQAGTIAPIKSDLDKMTPIRRTVRQLESFVLG